MTNDKADRRKANRRLRQLKVLSHVPVKPRCDGWVKLAAIAAVMGTVVLILLG
jgi:hypothetical protein